MHRCGTADPADEERVALGLAVDAPRPARSRRAASDRAAAHRRRGASRRRRPSRSPRSTMRSYGRLAAQRAQHLGERVRAIELDVAVGARGSAAGSPGELARQVPQQEQRRLVGPVQVVEVEHERRCPPPRRRNSVTLLEEAQALLLRLERWAAGSMSGKRWRISETSVAMSGAPAPSSCAANRRRRLVACTGGTPRRRGGRAGRLRPRSSGR